MRSEHRMVVSRFPVCMWYMTVVLGVPTSSEFHVDEPDCCRVCGFGCAEPPCCDCADNRPDCMCTWCETSKCSKWHCGIFDEAYDKRSVDESIGRSSNEPSIDIMQVQQIAGIVVNGSLFDDAPCCDKCGENCPDTECCMCNDKGTPTCPMYPSCAQCAPCARCGHK